MAGKQLKSMKRGALLALLVALSELDGIGNGKIANGTATKGRKGHPRESQAEVSEQEEQVPQIVRPWHDADLDARGDEGDEAEEGRFSDQMTCLNGGIRRAAFDPCGDLLLPIPGKKDKEAAKEVAKPAARKAG